jgi:VWFA-related protein
VCGSCAGEPIADVLDERRLTERAAALVEIQARENMSRWLCTAAALGLASDIFGGGYGLPPLAAQNPTPPAFSARSELVVLYVTVKEKSGAYVTGLSRDAFRVLEDGRRQQIQFFGMHDAPVTVGLIIDGSGSMAGVRDRVIAAAGAFAETSNRTDELFALIFNDNVEPVLPPDAPFTGDEETLRSALTRTLVARGRTALHDAIAAGLRYFAQGHLPGKVLVVVSDGGDNASTTTFDQVLMSAQAANTVIYTIALIDPLERDASRKRLRQLAEVTGGEAFQPRNMAQVDDVLRRIARDIRNIYTIGYVPADTNRDRRVRRLRVLVTAPNGRDVRVRTRQRYLLEK